MGLLRLFICVSGVYSTFLLWAIAQESLSTPFPSTSHHSRESDNHGGDKFPSSLFLNYAQAVASSLSAFLYLLFNSWRDGSSAGKSIGSVIGWSQLSAPSAAREKKSETNGEAKDPNGHVDHSTTVKSNGHANGHPVPVVSAYPKDTAWRKTLPVLLGQVAICQTTAGPIGFSALRHISYPTMVLGKSCKLIPVMLLNVMLYRRRFSSHKYVVVALVTVGISLFMMFGAKSKKGGGSDSLWGMSLLLINLLLDGLTNSTQDQIFASYPNFTGQQMMLAMSALTQAILLPFLIVPLPSHPISLIQHHLPAPMAPHLSPFTSSGPLQFARPAFLESLEFLKTHPTAIRPLLAYALLGGLGQLFIFETIQHFGSLTLVMITVTRKLFTMLLSVIVFDHRLARGQWAGIAVVFSGIGLEAAIKRRDVMRKARRD